MESLALSNKPSFIDSIKEKEMNDIAINNLPIILELLQDKDNKYEDNTIQCTALFCFYLGMYSTCCTKRNVWTYKQYASLKNKFYEKIKNDNLKLLKDDMSKEIALWSSAFTEYFNACLTENNKYKKHCDINFHKDDLFINTEDNSQGGSRSNTNDFKWLESIPSFNNDLDNNEINNNNVMVNLCEKGKIEWNCIENSLFLKPKSTLNKKINLVNFIPTTNVRNTNIKNNVTNKQPKTTNRIYNSRSGSSKYFKNPSNDMYLGGAKERESKKLRNKQGVNPFQDKLDLNLFQDNLGVKRNTYKASPLAKINRKKQEKANEGRRPLSENKYENCKICWEQFNVNDPLNFALICKCVVHNPCFNRHVITMVKASIYPIICPLCKKESIDQVTIQNILMEESEELEQRYMQYTLNLYQMNKQNDESHCPTPGCNFFFFYEKGVDYFKCELCSREYCWKCMNAWHNGQSCEEFKEKNKSEINLDDDAFYAAVVENNMKQCPFCKSYVEKIEGCNHMTCRCKQEFCYKCGVGYVDKEKQCEC